jgi:ribosome-binding protein aMBF1 (putative translation factor)
MLPNISEFESAQNTARGRKQSLVITPIQAYNTRINKVRASRHWKQEPLSQTLLAHEEFLPSSEI